MVFLYCCLICAFVPVFSLTVFCPRVQKMRAQTENTSSLLKERPLSGSLVPDACSQMLTSMDNLDPLKGMPEGVTLAIWDKFCLLRKAKVESELQVNIN